METTFKRPLQDIIADLKKPLDRSWIKQKKKGGSRIDFMPWFRYAELADMYAPGWEKDVSTEYTKDYCIVKVRIYINAEEGRFYRESAGYDADFKNGYGDPQTRAESMAFRRAWANWGLGRELYEKDDIDYEISGDGASGNPPTPHMRKVNTREKVQKIELAQVSDAEKFDKMKNWANEQILTGKTIEYVQNTCLQKLVPSIDSSEIRKAAREWVQNEWEVA